MTVQSLRIVILGLTITSSWGNGHASTYRSLMKALVRRGHKVLFLENDKPWYAAHRDLAAPPYGETALYADQESLHRLWEQEIASADLVILGSYVPEGPSVGRMIHRVAQGVTAFYDIDTPVTLAALKSGSCEYLTRDLVSTFDLYLSFTGGPTLRELETDWGARRALPLYCAVDPEVYRLETATEKWDLGYLGTYSLDRQPKLDEFVCTAAAVWPAGRFVVAGPLYPDELEWPANVARIEHLPPSEHRAFYAAQRFTLNVTRADMVRRGWSPSVRLFEAACCGTPIISDYWEGLDSFFEPGKEILIAENADDVLSALQSVSEHDRAEIGAAARARVLSNHTADHRAAELEGYVIETRLRRASISARVGA